MEQLFDAYESTLSAPYTSGGSSITVTAVTLPEGGNLPTSGNYTLTVRDSATGTVKAIFEVTSRSGSTLTTTAELDANCSAGDKISGYTLSKRSIVAYNGDWLGYGLFSALPASGAYTGSRYKCTDSPYEFIWNGATWDAYVNTFPSKLVLPISTGWTPDGVGGHIFSQTNGFRRITGITGSLNLGYEVRTVPATPYTINAAVSAASYITPGASFIGLTDGTKFVIMWTGQLAANDYAIGVTKWNTLSSVNSDYEINRTLIPNTNLVNFRLLNSGTNLVFSYSFDGYNYIQYDSRAVGDFLGTITGAVWGAWANNTTDIGVNLYSWNLS